MKPYLVTRKIIFETEQQIICNNKREAKASDMKIISAAIAEMVRKYNLHNPYECLEVEIKNVKIEEM